MCQKVQGTTVMAHLVMPSNYINEGESKTVWGTYEGKSIRSISCWDPSKLWSSVTSHYVVLLSSYHENGGFMKSITIWGCTWFRMSWLLLQPLVSLHYAWAVSFCLLWEMRCLQLAKTLGNLMSGIQWVSALCYPILQTTEPVFVLRLCPSYCLRIVVENDSYTCCLQSNKNEFRVTVQFCILFLKCQGCCEFWDTKEDILHIFRWTKMFTNHISCFYTKVCFAATRFKSKFRQFLNHNLDWTVWMTKCLLSLLPSPVNNETHGINDATCNRRAAAELQLQN